MVTRNTKSLHCQSLEVFRPPAFRSLTHDRYTWQLPITDNSDHGPVHVNARGGKKGRESIGRTQTLYADAQRLEFRKLDGNGLDERFVWSLKEELI